MKKTDHHSSHHHHDGNCCHHEHDAAEAAPVSPESITPPSAPPQDPLEVLQAEVNKYRDQSLRTAADLENYRKSDLFLSTWSKVKPLFANSPQVFSLVESIHSPKMIES